MLHRSPGVRSCCASALLFLLGLVIVSQPPYVNRPHQRLRGAQAQPQIAAAYGKLPLQFELNRGQTDPRVQFLSRGSGYTLFLAAGEAVLQLRNGGGARPGTPHSTASIRLKLVGANPAAQVAGLEELPGKVNYFIGNDPTKWRTNVPTYAKVQYRQVYTGVDLVYYGNQRQVEHDFVVAPGTDPKQIRLAVEGADRVELDSGDLVLHAAGADVRLRAPVAYQEMDGLRREVAASYVLYQADSAFRTPHSALDTPHSALRTPHLQEVGFQLADYDTSRPLVIDPVLVYSTYFGGSGYDSAYTIALDSSGSAYVAGMTSSLDFPTASPLRPSNGGYDDAFVAKLDPTGTALIYSTYLGGNDDDGGNSIAVDSSGNAYVTGFTWSSNFPTASPLKAWVCGGEACKDAFVAKLNPAGSALLYSTYLGGSDEEEAWGIAVDSAGNAYVTGYTYSIDSPTVNALRPANGGYYDAFVAKLNAAGSALLYSTYLGGSDDEEGWGIAVDSAGNAYVVGYTYSTDFPTASPLQGTLGGEGYGYEDAFVAKLNAAGSALVYSTYLGGSDHDEPWGIAVDSGGNVYVTGWTHSDDFPTASPLQGTPGGYQDAFVAKLNAAGSELLYSTYLGGGYNDVGWGIAVDSDGNAYVIGYTFSIDFPAATPLQATPGGYADAFVAKLDAAGSALEYSTYLGGVYDDVGGGIAVDSAGNAYVAGYTYSSDFPTAGPLQAASGGGQDLFIAKIGSASGSTDLALTKTGPTSVVAGSSITYTLTVTNNGPSPATGVIVRDPLPGSVTFVSATPSQGTCSGTTTVTCSLGSLAYLASATVTLVVQPAGAGTINNTASVSSNAGDPTPTDNSATATTVVPDFTLSVTPASQMVNAGGSATFTVTITGSGGFASSVNLSCSGLPAGASCLFTPNPAPPGTSSLALSTSGSTPAGTSTITVNGTSGSLSHSATTSLTVSGCNKAYVGSGTWETAASWSPTGLPASPDIACINSGSVVTLASNPTIAALLLGGTLSLNSGTLAIASTTVGSVASGGAVLNLNGGTLSLAGSLTVQSGGAFNWTGGTIGGAGSASIAPGAALNISGAGEKSFNTGTINNSGTATWTGAGQIAGYYGGTFNNKSGALFDAQNDSSFSNGSNGAPTFNNNAGATFRKSAGSVTTTMGGPCNNDGTLAVESGTVLLGNGGTSTGSYTVAASKALTFGGSTHNLNAGSSVSGAGTVNVTGGVVNVAGAYSAGTTAVSAGTLNFNSASGTTANAALSGNGTWGGSGHISVTGTMNWTGGTIAGAGSTDIAAGAALNISGAGEKSFNTGTINNWGTATWTGAGQIAGYYGGTFNNKSGALFDAQNDSSFSNGSNGAPTFNNNAGATFRKSAGSGTTTMGGPCNNDGTLAVESGTVLLGNGGTGTGAFTVPASMALTFSSSTHNLNAGSSVSGAGTVNVTGGVVNVAGSYSITTTTVAGGTANFNSTGGTTINLGLSSGTVAGSGRVTVTGTMNWTGGTIGGSGSTDVAAGAALNISGTGEKSFNTGTINNWGTATWTGAGQIAGYYGGTFNNKSGALFDAQNDSSFSNGSNGAPTFNNNAGATFRKSAGSVTTTMGGPCNNDGTLAVESGTVLLGNGGTSTGSYTVAASKALTFGGSTHNLNAGSGVSGAGTVSFTGGVVNVAGSYSASNTTVSGGEVYFTNAGSTANLAMSSGRLAANAQVTVTGGFNWTGGWLSGTGSVGIPAGVTLAISGTNDKTLSGTINNASTAATWTGAGRILAQYGGVFNNLAGGIFDAQSDAEFKYSAGSPAPNFNNAGTFRKSAGTGSTSFTSGALFNNSGTVDVRSGTLTFGIFLQTAGTSPTSAPVGSISALGGRASRELVCFLWQHRGWQK